MKEFHNSGIIQWSDHGGISVNGNNNQIVQRDHIFETDVKFTKQELSRDEWDALEKFFIERQLNYRSTDKCFIVCTDILQAIEKREQNSVRSVLQKVGKSVLNTLLGVGITSATRVVVMPIIEKIMG